jgi:hypothetical protein
MTTPKTQPIDRPPDEWIRDNQRTELALSIYTRMVDRALQSNYDRPGSGGALLMLKDLDLESYAREAWTVAAVMIDVAARGGEKGPPEPLR